MNILVFSLFIQLNLYNANSGTRITESIFTATCPAPNETNKSIVEDFLTEPGWVERRNAASAGGLTISQISILIDSHDSTACTSFNTIYQEAIEEENGFGEQAYNVTYYNAGALYFVVITIRQPTAEDAVSFGINYIDIYDQNLTLIKGYAF